ncbi:hypothetical protein GW17_00040077, partial [Ensete ventricosum]
MSDVNNASDTAFATAVAAAAYAITSLEEEEDPLNQRRLPAKIKSKREDSMNKPIDSILSRWLTGKEPKDDEKQSETIFRYERMMNEIREWETQKKLKAKHRLERKEVYDYC